MKKGISIILVIFTVLALLITIFAGNNLTEINGEQYRHVQFERVRRRVSDNVAYYYFENTRGGMSFAIRGVFQTNPTNPMLLNIENGKLSLNLNNKAVGYIDIKNLTCDIGLDGKYIIDFYVKDNGNTVYNVLLMGGSYYESTHPKFPSFDFSGGFFSDFLEVVTGIFKILYYPVDITIYIVNTLGDLFSLFGGIFSL